MMVVLEMHICSSFNQCYYIFTRLPSLLEAKQTRMTMMHILQQVTEIMILLLLCKYFNHILTNSKTKSLYIHLFISPGGIAFLSQKDLEFGGHLRQFSILELYGGAHVAFLPNVTRMAVETVVGDDTSYFHIGPGYHLDVNHVMFISLCKD